MNTPDKRVEWEKEFDEQFADATFADGTYVGRLIIPFIRTTLTQYHQDLMSEAVEKIEKLPTYMHGTPKRDGAIEMHQTIDKNDVVSIIKSLPPPIKSDVR